MSNIRILESEYNDNMEYYTRLATTKRQIVVVKDDTGETLMVFGGSLNYSPDPQKDELITSLRKFLAWSLYDRNFDCFDCLKNVDKSCDPLHPKWHGENCEIAHMMEDYEEYNES